MLTFLFFLHNFSPGEGNKQLPLVNARFYKISSDWFSWTPPCFPVLSTEFQYVDTEINGTHKQIPVSRESVEHITCAVRSAVHHIVRLLSVESNTKFFGNGHRIKVNLRLHLPVILHLAIQKVQRKRTSQMMTTILLNTPFPLK